MDTMDPFCYPNFISIFSSCINILYQYWYLVSVEHFSKHSSPTTMPLSTINNTNATTTNLTQPTTTNPTQPTTTNPLPCHPHVGHYLYNPLPLPPPPCILFIPSYIYFVVPLLFHLLPQFVILYLQKKVFERFV